MALYCALGLGMLLALPGTLGSGDNLGSSSVTVVLLLLLLLLLITGLALAWRRLSRDSGGYYHPARLGTVLWDRTSRLFWTSPPGHWLQTHFELGSPDNAEGQEDVQDAEDEDVVDGMEKVESQEDKQHCGAGTHLEQALGHTEEAPDTDAEGGSGGSAEALLSDLHAFSGSAAWDDSAGATGGQSLHVTAL
ncbi:Protein tyrosine phosphatase receptor type C-associated protein [Heterocephalus glaber]|uniref:Protein tyrosine phosphatase receptor type C-associated protein n=1 Tax=Heterocephalus glaber TaxID=10181 RepID=G5BSA6_HETGA|nr:protein tyrosine phosphatase receptor type C-associated protein [Heterocephalus glaber]EHB12167.1 Protein tyrosine phosphatase receptor type C-associated protein [Heterocephalus glaber]